MHASRMHLSGPRASTVAAAHGARTRAHVPRAFCSPDTRVALRLRQTCRTAGLGVSRRVDLAGFNATA